VITSVQRRRRWPTAEKIRLVEETMQPGMSVSYVARRAGVAPSLLFNWRRRMLEGGLQAVQADEDVVGTSRVRELERRVRELERLLGRKTMEVEILKEALDVARVKKTELAAAVMERSKGRFAMKAVADTLALARSNLIERGSGAAKPRRPYRKAGDKPLLALIRRLVDERPTYGYRRITRLVNRRQMAEGKPNINAKRVLRIMQANQLTPGTTHWAAASAHARRHRDRPALECSLVLRSLRACLPQRRDRPRIVRHRRLRSGDHRLVGYDRGYLRPDSARPDGRLCRASVRHQQGAASRRMVVR